MTTYIRIAVLFFYSAISFAQSMELGEPTIGGSGCLKESTSIQISPEEQVVNLNFDGYIAHSYSEGAQLDRKTCAIAIPLKVPEGYQVAVLDLELSGFSAISESAEASLRIETFLAGQSGHALHKSLQSGANGFFNVSTERLSGERKIWSGCGQDTVLRINTAVLAHASEEESRALVIVDSAKTLKLEWRRCH